MTFFDPGLVVAGGPVERRSSPVGFRIVTAMTALTLAASGTPSPLYVEYESHWHFSPAVLTTVYATYAGGVIIALLFAGGLSDRIGRRPALVGNVSGLALSLVLFLLAGGLAWLYVARAVQGLATGVFTATAAATMADLYHRRDGRRAGLVNSAAQSVGIAVGAVVAGALAQWALFPLRTPYAVLLVLFLLLLAWIVRSVPETVTRPAAVRMSTLIRPQRLAVPESIRQQFGLATAGVFAAWSAGGLYLALGGAISKELLHVDNHLMAGLVILCVQGFGGLTSLLFPNVANRAAAVVACLALVAGLGIVSSSVVLVSAPLFVVGDLVAGVGFGVGFMTSTRRVTQAAPLDRSGQVVAAYFVVAYLAISVPSIGAGIVAGYLGLAGALYLFAVLIGALALVTGGLVRLADRRPVTPRPS